MKIENNDPDEKQLHEIRVKLVTLYLNQLPDAARWQQKYELLTEIMNGEGANKSADIWITLLADFAIAVGNMGHDPKMVLLNIRREADKLVAQKLQEQGMTRNAPKGARPN